MSLFGSSPDDSTLSAQPARPNQKSSLFDDEQTPGAKSGSSLFDDEGTSGPSPWDMPTPKKAGRSDLVKRLLPASDVPESYIDAFDALRETNYKAEGGQIGIAGAKKVFDGSGLDTSEQDRILKLVTRGQETELGRNEFNVLLALIGLSQESEEASLDSVDERRRNLPEPSIPFIKQIRSAKVSENLGETSPKQPPSAPPKQTSPGKSPPKSRRIRKDSLENLDHDPWSSPALHTGHTHTVNNEATPSSIPTAAKPIRNGLTEPSRTTSAFTTYSDSPSSTMPTGEDTRDPPVDGSAGGWGSEGPPSGGFPNAGQSGVGFGSSGDDQGDHTGGSVGRSLGGGRTTSRGVEETVTVALLPEKEGMFMFQHHNYEVKSARRASSVVRRYSDFVWLLDCLHKRYSFRALPLLPPKRVAVNGRHLSADVTFMEKRRRGLVRFVNALVRHPVLSQEQLVVMFLTVPTELAVWRKQATISVQEEFLGKSLPSGLEDSLPTNLSEIFDTVRSGVRESSEKYIGLCGLLERLAKRNQGIAADYLRFSQALMAVTETSQSTYATDTNDVPLLNEGISSTAKHLTTSQSLLEDEARAWDEGVLEDFKKQRDTLVSIRDMFDRRDRFAKDNIPYLERRIESNENKLAGLMGRPEGAPAKPGEQEKLEQAVRADKQSIVDQHARGVFIKECIRDELVFFQQSQYQVSRLHQDWSQERVKYAELQADNWRALSEEVDNMPLGE
ncbi:Sorting nexin mvp1 [Imshaugia aleurites]|uniref:Sorting nexin MVP1 n=1 Tax=Imshaugia aleurites TaxID=172621 RepID=A0A8H3PH84_9LECA|nr:Sorting nexin mvp1 [Imshaugia aleurites]